MDGTTFDRLTRTLALAGTRRAVLAAVLTGAGTVLSRAAPPARAQDCLANGERCSDGTECCSGRCERRKRGGKKVCRRVRRQGTCTVRQNTCDGGSIACGTNRGGDTCRCYLTTRGSSFCGDDDPALDTCGCTSNESCARRLGNGAKCVQLGGACPTCPSGDDVACMRPCTCAAADCPDGCCANGVCVSPPTDAQCGTGGTACVACTGSETCGGGDRPGVCGCTPDCGGKACGDDDGCGSPCQTGSCPSGEGCKAGTCVAFGSEFECDCSDGSSQIGCRAGGCTEAEFDAACGQLCAAHGGDWTTATCAPRSCIP